MKFFKGKQTKNQQLAQYLDSATHWRGWTIDYLGIACTSERAAARAFGVLSRDARNAALDVVVARGVLRDDSARSHFMAGLLCMNKDVRRYINWIGTIDDIDDADIQGPQPFYRLEDKDADYFRRDSCPLSIGEFYVVGGEVVDLRSEEGKAFEQEAQSPLSSDDEAAARQLVALVREAQEYEGGQYAEIREAKYEQIKNIGRQLSANGGHNRMLKIGYRVRALDSLAGSYVESYWNGIGDWQG